MNGLTKGLVALIGGALITGAIGFAINSAKASEKIVVDKSGVSVKLSNVIAEVTSTGVITSVNGGNFSSPVIFKMEAVPAKINEMITDAGATTASLAKADGVFCFVTFVTYKDKEAGVVDVPIGSECKSFPAGTVLGSVVSFAEDYTKEVSNTYKTKFNVLK